MKNTLIVIAVLVVVFLLGRWTKNFDPVKIVQYDTLPPVVRLDTVRDTVPVPEYVHIVRYDTIHDTADGKPIHLPIPRVNKAVSVRICWVSALTIPEEALSS